MQFVVASLSLPLSFYSTLSLSHRLVFFCLARKMMLSFYFQHTDRIAKIVLGFIYHLSLWCRQLNKLLLPINCATVVTRASADTIPKAIYTHTHTPMAVRIIDIPHTFSGDSFQF